MGKLPKREIDVISDEFIAIAERVRRKYKLTIPESKHELDEILWNHM
jgi:hypothetical protein